MQPSVFHKKLGLRFKRRFFQYFVQAIKNPSWLFMFVLGRISFIRRLALFISKRPLIKEYQKCHSYFEGVSVDLVTKALKKDRKSVV